MNHTFPVAVLHPTNWYGYPTVSAPRRLKPSILAVIHTTETYSVPFPSSTKSWTFSVERDGTVHQFMDPVIAAPWTNGDIQNPDTSNPLVKAMVGSAYNPNEFCFLTIENVNRIADGQRLTAAQIVANHAILAWASKISGLPVDRTHVVGHYQINGNSRVNCPTVPTDRGRVFDGVISGLSLPDTALEDYVANLSYMTPAKVTIRPETSVRLRPDLSAESKPWVVGKTAVVTAIAQVKDGEDFGAGPLWYAYVIDVGGLRYFHSQDVVKIEPMGQTVEVIKEVPTGITQADVDRQVQEAKDLTTKSIATRILKALGF